MENCLPLEKCFYNKEIAETGDYSSFTAEQYLSFVRDQSEKMPTVSRADIDSSNFKNNQTVYSPEISTPENCREEFLPSSEWEESILYDFQNLRNAIFEKIKSYEVIPRLITLPAMKDEKNWFAICSDPKDDEWISDVECEDEDELSDTSCMSNSDLRNNVNKTDEDFILALDSNNDIESNIGSEKGNTTAGVSLLTSENRNFLERRRKELNSDINVQSQDLKNSNVSNSCKYLYSKIDPSLSLILQFDQVLTQRIIAFNINWLENAEYLSLSRSQWIYALLAKLETPLYQDTVALLRQLYRKCCSLRANLQLGENNIEFNKYLARINLLIFLTGSYFGQGELYSTTR